ncbi:hypothetical protein CHH69_14360 [Terribacillus saccharophilus]|uniref:HAD-IIA family hydrolase n=1 Tax=Terribacillus saccharophilus TaxID=361277 RepID=UPI000BA5C024|nr:HAD-IIA family hydrolase [Terribacillus saccharophilus]PAF34708.1 hypothetical protein CHH69_14360 [Terribacillus saccharophilus]PAF36288.1 hypothetical protein CHH58_12820 [Terribacillus saccharophilus]
MAYYKTLDSILFDLDGTVWKDFTLIDGAAETIRTLQEAGKRVIGLSNRGTHSRKQITNYFREQGIKWDKEDIILSSYLAADYLQTHYPRLPVWVLGEEGLREELSEAGLTLAKEPEDADWLVISLHTGVTYHDLNQAFRAVIHGARILATNQDPVFPGNDGLQLDVGGLIGAIEASTGKKTDIIVGKPSHFMYQKVMQQAGSEPEKTMIVGDSLTSDIAMGAMFGLKTALVLTGNTTKEQADISSIKPDLILPSIKELPFT